MPPVITSIAALKQNLTGGAFEALSAATGDSLSIITYYQGAAAYVEEIFAGDSASKMEVEVFSPRFGDNQNGLRMQQMFNPTLSGADGVPQLLLPNSVDIPAWSADTLSVSVNGTAADNANVVMQLYYTDMPGSAQRLARYDFIEQTIRQGIGGTSRVLGIEVTVTPGATGNYGTSVALNANDDRLQADFDYALIGYSCDQPVLSFGIRGPDTSFLRIPMPGHWNTRITADWFLRQSQQRNQARVPIINANNKGSTLLDAIHPSNAGATKLSLYLAQLPTRFQG